MNASLNFDIEYSQLVNYTLVHNHIPILGKLVLENRSSEDFRDIRIMVRGEYFNQSFSPVYPSLESGRSLRIKDLEIQPDAGRLAALSERVVTSFTLAVIDADEEVFAQDFKIELMAFNQWLGSKIMPQCLASFVMPNLTLIDNVVVKAGRYLKERTGSSSFTAYQSGDPNQVLQQVSAIFAALHDENIIYREAPASYESSGQRIQLPYQVLQNRIGNCIELTLLMASVLENVGIHPIITLIPGHAYLGVWLVEDCYAHSVGDDASFLEKKCSKGISEIAVIESTELTQEKTSFETACQKAENALSHIDNFDMFIDVYRCRLEGIRPLPVRTLADGQWNIDLEGAEHEGTDTDVHFHTRYDLDRPENATHELSKFDIWERKLLDFSLRNTMLNLYLRRRAVQFISFDVDRIEDHLQDGEEYCLLSKPVENIMTDTEERLLRSKQFPELRELITNDIEHRILHTYQPEGESKSILKNIYRSARTSIEETGANSLFLAIGTLRWFENEMNGQAHYAPILLLPVEMVYKKGQYYIRTRDEEITLNVTLFEFLRQNFDIRIKGLDVLPKDEHGVDVSLIFALLRDGLKDQQRWDVEEECILGNFSFNKFLMWNDIHTHHEQFKDNNVVASLVKGGLTWTPDEIASSLSEQDKTVRPSDMAIPVPVDSSQMAAVHEAGKGNSFILYGPPGTGKSQTITNLIANALFQGKRVLFVAEKMAALSVVEKRLTQIGLEPFCLELHSNKATKKHILEQLDKALSVSHIQKPSDYGKIADDLYQQRMGLIKYMEALHNVDEQGFSLYDSIVRYESLGVQPLEIASTVPIKNLNTGTIADYEHVLSGPLGAVFEVVGQPSRHPLHDLIIKKEALASQSEFISLLNKAVSVLEAIQRTKGSASQGAQVSSLQSSDILDKYLEFVSIILEAEKKSGADLHFLFDADSASCLESYSSSKVQLENMRKQILASSREEIFSQDAVSLQMEWHLVQNKWFIPRFFASRSFVKKMRFFSPDINADGVKSFLDTLFRYQKQTRELESQRSVCQQAMSSLLNIEDVRERLQRWISNESQLRDWYQWCEYRDRLTGMNLDAVVQNIESRTVNPSEVSDSFFKGYFYRKCIEKISANENLSTFEGTMFDESIKRYKELTQQFQELCKKELYARLAANVPRVTDGTNNSSEIGLLKRNISNGGRGLSIRDLFDQLPQLLPRLCPCMLMSPMSVAQYINIDQKKFDLVIFDEASQMPTSEAVGAIARGNALVVVGDPKQMPPTSFFTTNNVDEDEAYIDDMESILEDCRALGVPSLQLSWHYRSRHESLIAFSNNEYYDGSLITFPSVDDKQTKVNYVYVNGVYDKGGRRSNPVEAKAIVDEVERRLLDPEQQQYSIGIISFSVVQQNLIEDLLNDRLEKNRQLAEIAEKMYEPIFVKNLENVQGDERDIILFSVGYGPDKKGNVSMNFGPLNNVGGERRLNVAVSRARHQMIVYSALHAGDIDLRRSNAKGVEGLRHFLEYAEFQTLAPIAANSASVSDTVIAEQIAEALRGRGYQVQRGVGRSQFKVDVAIEDRDNPGTYLLGIILDGESYHNTKTTRDREIVQPSVLQSLSWNVMRVWSVDWFNKPDRVLARIEKAYSQPAPRRTAPTATPAFDISGETETEMESRAMEYNRCEFPRTMFSASRDIIYKIVETEQPILFPLLCKRVAAVLGKPRVTPSIQSDTERLSAGLYRTGDRDTYALYLNEEAARSFTGYRKASGRDITEIPLVEVENALLETIATQLPLTEDDALFLAARQLGFTHRGGNIVQAFQTAVDKLIQESRIERNDGRLVLK